MECEKENEQAKELKFSRVEDAVRWIRAHKLDEYRDYFRNFFTYKPVTIAQTFATREEADEWLTGGNAKDGDLVKIADQGFVVYEMPKGLKFVPRPLPEELEPPDSK